MNDFMYYNPVRVHFGADAMSHLPEELGKFGANVLLTYGGGSIKRTGLYDRVLDALRAAGKSVYELSGIMTNPRTEKVYEGIELCRKHKIDLILAVGGGSTIDCSKAIAVGAPAEGDFWEKFYVNWESAETGIPLGVILTIPATAASWTSPPLSQISPPARKTPMTVSVSSRALPFLTRRSHTACRKTRW